MKGLPLSLCTFIWTYPVCFTVMKRPYSTSMYLSIYNSDPGTKYENSGVMWQVAPDSKIKLVSCNISPYSILGLSLFEYIRTIDAYILCDSFCSVFLSDALSIFQVVCTSFRLVRVTEKYLFLFFRFLKILNPVILRSTYEARIWLYIATFSTFIWTELLISLSFYMLLKTILSWVWSSTMNALWVRNFPPLCSLYWMVQIQVINLQGR